MGMEQLAMSKIPKIHGYFVVGFAHRLGGSRWKLAENLIPITWVVDDDDDDDDAKLYTKISGPFSYIPSSNDALAALCDMDNDEHLSDIRNLDCEVTSGKNLEDTMPSPFRKRKTRHG